MVERHLYIYKRIEQKGNKIKCKRKEDIVHKKMAAGKDDSLQNQPWL